MKKYQFPLLLLLFLACFVSFSHAQVTPPVQKEPFDREREKERKKMNEPTDGAAQDTPVVTTPQLPAGIDSNEMRCLAGYIQDPDIVIGIFDLPGENEPIRTMANGHYPETDDNYLDLAITMGIIKLNTTEPVRGDFDSMIFVQMPALFSEQHAEPTFYPFPATRWLLFLKKGIKKMASGKTETIGWVNDLKNDVSSYFFLTDRTAFLLASDYYGNYYMQWRSTQPIPSALVKVDDKFVSDVKDIVALLSSIPAGTDKQVFNSKIEILRTGLRTDKAKYLCLYLKP